MVDDNTNTVNYYAVDQLVYVDGNYGKTGRWYECRQVQAESWAEAKKKAFPPRGEMPPKYRLRLL
jgi:hypothetical protein